MSKEAKSASQRENDKNIDRDINTRPNLAKFAEHRSSARRAFYTPKEIDM